MGQLHKGPDQPLNPRSFKLQRIDHVGTYALQPVWGDGHATGLYTFDYLKAISQPQA
jgi:DUF971 family protein